MIKIISFKICPFVQRVTGALAAKNIPFEVEYINLKEKPQWFLDISPNGQVPVMSLPSGTVLFESDAIIEFIEDEYGPLEQGVSNEQRALDRAWSYLGSKHYMAQCGTMSSQGQDTFKQRAEKLIKVFARVEKQLASETRFFKSDHLSQVDIAWLPLLHRAAIVKTHTNFDFLCGLPKMQAWQNALLQTDILQSTVSEDFEQRFKDFYLTGTYLAQGEDVPQGIGCDSNTCCV
ncbi:MAG: glutathione S-transferase family protein [Algicola sp.]|nr:glutathione S-transferase family protein [Algicola sp.]